MKIQFVANCSSHEMGNGLVVAVFSTKDIGRKALGTFLSRLGVPLETRKDNLKTDIVRPHFGTSTDSETIYEQCMIFRELNEEPYCSQPLPLFTL